MQNDIIAMLYTDKRFRIITRNACKDCGYHYSDDIHSEVVLKIIEVGDDLREIDNLFFYFHAFVIRTIKYDYTTAKKYGFNHNRIDLPTDNISDNYIQDDECIKTITDKFIERKDDLLADKHTDQWRDKYERELFKLYLHHKSYRAVQNAVGIPFRSVADALKSFKEKLKKQL